MEMEQELISLRRAAEYARVTWHTIYMASRNGKLWVERIDNRIYTTQKAVDDYRVSRHAGELRKRDGVPIYGGDRWTISQTAKFIAEVKRKPMPYHAVVRLIQTGKLKATRDGRWWVVHKADVVAYCEMQLDPPRQLKLLTYK